MQLIRATVGALAVLLAAQPTLADDGLDAHSSASSSLMDLAQLHRSALGDVTQMPAPQQRFLELEYAYHRRRVAGAAVGTALSSAALSSSIALSIVGIRNLCVSDCDRNKKAGIRIVSGAILVVAGLVGLIVSVPRLRNHSRQLRGLRAARQTAFSVP